MQCYCMICSLRRNSFKEYAEKKYEKNHWIVDTEMKKTPMLDMQSEKKRVRPERQEKKISKDCSI